MFTFHGDAVRVTTNPWRHRQSRGENASELIHDLNVTDFIPTHSSNERRQNGLVTKFSKVKVVDVETENVLELVGKGIMRVAKKPT